MLLDKNSFPILTVLYMKHDFPKGFLQEMVKFYFYALFLTLFFSAFTIYRQLLLEEYTHTYLHLGYGVFEALVMAKVLVIGEALNLGKRFENKPLIVPTFCKAVIFSLFVLVLTLIEHVFVGYFSGKSWTLIYQHLMERGFNEILARAFVMFFVFVLFFAFKETGRVIGDRRLYELFFHRRNPT